MTKRRSSNPESSTLTAKKARGERRTIKDKFCEKRGEEISEAPLKPLNPKQRLYMDMIEDDDIPLILASGYAGTSKTYIPTVMACDALRKGEIDKIVFT